MKKFSRHLLVAAVCALLTGAFSAAARPPPDPCYKCWLIYNQCLRDGGDPISCLVPYQQCLEDRGCAAN